MSVTLEKQGIFLQLDAAKCVKGDNAPLSTRSGKAIDVRLDDFLVEGWRLVYKVHFLRGVLEANTSELSCSCEG